MAKKTQKVSLASLAEEIGVSRTTVSNAYNHPEQLSPQLRKKIFAAAKRRGYPGPDPMARSLRTKRVGSVGVLLTEHLSYAFEDKASVDFLAGLADASSDLQTSVTLIPADPQGTDKNHAIQLVNSAVVDGFVVYSVAHDDPFLAAVRMRNLPTVICDQPANVAELPFVGIDDKKAIAPAAQALVDAGHRKIGILCIRLDISENNGRVSLDRVYNARHHVQQARILGALEVFTQAGIAIENIPIIERHINNRQNNLAAAQELLDNHPELSAVLCTTDTMALAVLEYAQHKGLVVPQDLSVTGFDGINIALLHNLSTIIQPNRAKGAYAGKRLAHMLHHGMDHQRELLDTQFHAGGTIAAPRVL
ncbi:MULTISPECIES: LacI family DNA-binding transcriptional regulator [unclassified Corynebacterium]|uniref:LacI family DNA-binding transcriptional regulator n=1 Tax=unclassified Corynebacterium TaxID=2624378 RepID=UPI00163DBA9C|nr:LacI family DNA-binding transcriptional regulator [Corynebacterium sp. SY003]